MRFGPNIGQVRRDWGQPDVPAGSISRIERSKSKTAVQDRVGWIRLQRQTRLDRSIKTTNRSGVCGFKWVGCIHHGQGHAGRGLGVGILLARLAMRQTKSGLFRIRKNPAKRIASSESGGRCVWRAHRRRRLVELWCCRNERRTRVGSHGQLRKQKRAQ